MKKFLKGFTLVEILIVIVIIGILISALVPRMSAAQGRARDVARKNDLSNLQAAIIVAYQDLGRYPCTTTGCTGGNEGAGLTADNGLDVKEMQYILEAAGMNTVPQDPLKTNNFYGLGAGTSSNGNYRYITMKSHGVTDGGFAVMAKTEVAGGSNWVTCVNGTSVTTGAITSGMDSKTLKLCTNLTKGSSSTDCANDYNGNCRYGTEEDLRYVMLY